MPSDSEIIDWLESLAPLYICLPSGNAIDVKSSPLNFRATLAEYMDKEVRNAQQVG